MALNSSKLKWIDKKIRIPNSIFDKNDEFERVEYIEVEGFSEKIGTFREYEGKKKLVNPVGKKKGSQEAVFPSLEKMSENYQRPTTIRVDLDI